MCEGNYYEYPTTPPKEELERPPDEVDHRSKGGPRLTYLWCHHHHQHETPGDENGEEEALTGQSLYLGGEIGSDGNVYMIPGHAPRVMVVDLEETTTTCTTNTSTDRVSLVGPRFPGKYKWLRGVVCGDLIYGIPCHADTVLRIHVPNRQVTVLPIEYEEFYGNDNDDNQAAAAAARQQEWKYHGAAISEVDGCIYAIPQSALHVLRIDPKTDSCRPVGPTLPGRYKWYGGIIGKQDKAIYGIPHNSSQVLRILPADPNSNNSDETPAQGTPRITLHGDLGVGGHKWHGAAAAPNGVIVSVPANADTVLCITPPPAAAGGSSNEPILTQLSGANGTTTTIQTGRHRKDRKYKYLGAITGTDGCVYCFPSGSEQVLQIDTRNTTTMSVRTVGPNIYDTQMERLCQNKWQNGVTLTDQQCVYAIPLAAESVLRIDSSSSSSSMSEQEDQQPPEPTVTTWPLPAPHRGLAKWEGAVVAPNGAIYCVPNNHKAVLRIQHPAKQQPENEETKPKQSSTLSSSSSSSRGKPCEEEMKKLTYRSGIPTLRSSAHRVKYSPKGRKQDPKPKNRQGYETGTTWLPPEVCQEEVFSYNVVEYDLQGALVNLLSQSDAAVVGEFRNNNGSPQKLQDFVVPPPSTWRGVNGGNVENAQKYLSDLVLENKDFLAVFDRLVQEHVLPHLKRRLVAVGSVAAEEKSTTFYYQRPPTLRLQPGPAWAQVKPHNDAEYGHQNGELNFWIPLTDRTLTRVDLHCESKAGSNDYHPIPAMPGQIISFHGSSCKHFVNPNESEFTRVSLDFRVGVQGFYDPHWCMRGTTDDHGRKEVLL